MTKILSGTSCCRRVHSRSGDAVLGTLNLNITDCPEPSPQQQGEPESQAVSGLARHQ